MSSNNYWKRLFLANNKHGTQSMRDILHNDLKLPRDGKLVHSWLATAKENRKCNIQAFVWENLLGPCKEECTCPCNRETNVESLDMTSIYNIFMNAEHIIPYDILSQTDIINVLKKFLVPIKSMNENYLAYYVSPNVMPEPEFNDKWIQLRKELVQMGYTHIAIFDDLKTCSLDPQIEETVKTDSLKIKEEMQRKRDGDIYRKINWKGRTYTFDDVYQMLRDERFEDVKQIIDQNEFALESLHGNEFDDTLLMKAAWVSNVSAFTFLVKFPQDFNTVNRHEMNIAHCILSVWKDDKDYVCLDMFRMLREQTTKDTFHRLINRLDMFGDSPIHHAARRNYHRTIKFLIDNGANMNVRNKKGELPEIQKECRNQTKRRSYRN